MCSPPDTPLAGQQSYGQAPHLSVCPVCKVTSLWRVHLKFWAPVRWGQLNFVRWRLIYVLPQHETWFVAAFWCLECGKSVHPRIRWYPFGFSDLKPDLGMKNIFMQYGVLRSELHILRICHRCTPRKCGLRPFLSTSADLNSYRCLDRNKSLIIALTRNHSNLRVCRWDAVKLARPVLSASRGTGVLCFRWRTKSYITELHNASSLPTRDSRGTNHGPHILKNVVNDRQVLRM